MMTSTDWDLYCRWIKTGREFDSKNTSKEVVNSILSNLENNPAYQAGATRNGNKQPILATRKETRKCKMTVIPGDSMCIGDLIHVFGEKWICMELYTDEYGITYGELWMCNHEFRFQDKTHKIVSLHGIIDDGSYSKGANKAITITEGKYTCYLSRNEETSCIHVDKRFAVDAVLDAKGSTILEVGKVVWIDTKSGNYGEGSHLITFVIENDVYNPEVDNVDELICDYVCCEGEPMDSQGKAGRVFIEGKNTVRIGTGRTYTAAIIEEDGSKNKEYKDFQWSIRNKPNGVEIIPDGSKCLLNIPLEDELIGSTLTLTCEDVAGLYTAENKEVAVITIG